MLIIKQMTEKINVKHTLCKDELSEMFIKDMTGIYNDAINRMKQCIDEYDKAISESEKERIKDYKELTIGEKFVLYLLNNKILPADKDIVKNAEAIIVNDKVVDFAVNHDNCGFIRDMISELINSLWSVDVNKLRNITCNN